jgi:aspartyl-tRNA(Asn)/glutamyl-tRNA(Gln) amidotransferase subunit C
MIDVEHVARLARLALSAAEAERMREQLSGILAYIDTLRALDTTAVEPTSHAGPPDHRGVGWSDRPSTS